MYELYSYRTGDAFVGCEISQCSTTVSRQARRPEIVFLPTHALPDSQPDLRPLNEAAIRSARVLPDLPEGEFTQLGLCGPIHQLGDRFGLGQ